MEGGGKEPPVLQRDKNWPVLKQALQIYDDILRIFLHRPNKINELN